MIAAPAATHAPSVPERFADLFYDARHFGLVLTAGYPEQGGYWLARAHGYNAMARWLPDLDAVEQVLEKAVTA